MHVSRGEASASIVSYTPSFDNLLSKKMTNEILERVDIATDNHYYETFTFVDQITYTACRFTSRELISIFKKDDGMFQLVLEKLIISIEIPTEKIHWWRGIKAKQKSLYPVPSNPRLHLELEKNLSSKLISVDSINDQGLLLANKNSISFFDEQGYRSKWMLTKHKLQFQPGPDEFKGCRFQRKEHLIFLISDSNELVCLDATEVTRGQKSRSSAVIAKSIKCFSLLGTSRVVVCSLCTELKLIHYRQVLNKSQKHIEVI